MDRNCKMYAIQYSVYMQIYADLVEESGDFLIAEFHSDSGHGIPELLKSDTTATVLIEEFEKCCACVGHRDLGELGWDEKWVTYNKVTVKYLT